MDLSISSQAIKETGQFFQMHEKFSFDGQISSTEGQSLNSYRNNNMTANQTMRDDLEFTLKYTGELGDSKKL
jgi:hypothetical protein